MYETAPARSRPLGYVKMLTARDHEQNGHRRDAGFGEHQAFAECVSGIVSVGRNAIELVKEM